MEEVGSHIENVALLGKIRRNIPTPTQKATPGSTSLRFHIQVDDVKPTEEDMVLFPILAMTRETPQCPTQKSFQILAPEDTCSVGHIMESGKRVDTSTLQWDPDFLEKFIQDALK